MIEGHNKYNETTKEQSKYAGINWDRLMGDAEGAGCTVGTGGAICSGSEGVQ